MRRASIPARDRAMPLEEFPPDRRAAIEEAAAQDRPPAKWHRLELAQIPSRAWYEWHWRRGVDPDARRPSIPRSVRKAVLERDGLVCQLCGDDVEPGDVHLDHIHPYSKGGADTVSNLQVAHSTCNIRKGARV